MMNPNLIHLLREVEKRRPPLEIDSLVDLSYPQQANFVRDTARYQSALCTRRAGKSVGLGFKFLRAALKHPHSLCPYLSLTRDSAKNIMWPVFHELNEKYKLGARMLESSLSVVLPNGSRIKCFGADQKNFINRLRGSKYPFVGIDEAQSFGSHLSQLIDDIVTPAIADYADGALAVTGTPGPIAEGLFYDITTGKLGYSVHKWTVFDNPYMPNPRGFVEDLKRRKGWDDHNPTFLREWQGEWVTDPDALCYKFRADRNLENSTFEQLLNRNRDPWFYVLGVDLGYDPDPSAFVLCAYQRNSPTLYIVETFKQTKMIVSDVAERIKYTLKRHPYAKVVIDAGGQGKQISEEIKQRYGIPLTAAEKTGKSGFIEIMNSDLLAGRIKILKDVSPPLVDEWSVLAWDASSPDRKEDSRYSNHLSDAALYSWRWAYNYAWEKREQSPAPHSEEAVNKFWQKESEGVQKPNAPWDSDDF